MADRPRHIVLLSYYFPPDRAVGAIRPSRLARELARGGHQVSVIKAAGAEEPPVERTPEIGISVHPVRSHRSLRELGRSMSRTRQPSGGGTPAAGRYEPGWTPPDSIAFWKRWLFSLMWLPDDTQGFVLPAMRAGRAAVAAGANLIYSSGPPFTTHLAALLLKLRTGLPWIAEFRDPWTDNPGKPAFVRSAFSDATERWLERRVLKNADLVVTATEGSGALLASKLGNGRKSKVIAALSGIEALRSEADDAVPRSGPLRVLYTGNLYLSRDPTPFLRALGEARRALALGPDGLRLDLVGDCRHFHGRPVLSIAEEYGVGELVHFTDWAAPEACQELQQQADLLLLLAAGQPTQVPNKLYEYLGTRRPILAIVDADGESARLLERAGGHHVVTERHSAQECGAIVANALQQARIQGPRGDLDVLDEWKVERQMNLLLRRIEALP